MSEEPPIEERLKRTESMLERVLGVLGLGPPSEGEAEDPRRGLPIPQHMTDIRDAVHRLNNTTQVLNEYLRRVIETTERNAQTSQQNQEGIAEIKNYALALTEQAKLIREQSDRIRHAVMAGVPEKPLMMRDLFFLETNTTEISLFLFAFGESIIFLVGDQKLKNSSMFISLSSISPDPAVWGIGVGLLALYSVVAFACRRRQHRRVAMFAQSIYFGVTGLMPLFMSPGVLGWWPHLLAFTGAFWVLSRGPSQAI